MPLTRAALGAILAGFLGLGPGLFVGSAQATPRSPAPATECKDILHLAGQLAKLVENFPAQGTRAMLDPDDSFGAIASNSLTPGWVKDLIGAHNQIRPHLEFILFADSVSLAQVTAIQLRDLGLRSAPEAARFLENFPNLPMDRQLAFVNGLVFRLLFETLNLHPPEHNRSRLRLSDVDFSQMRSFLSRLHEDNLPTLALFLMCQLGFRSHSFAAAVSDHWQAAGQYGSPVSPEARPWTTLHGTFLHPVSGQPTYPTSELVTLVRTGLALQTTQAIAFLIEHQAQQFSHQELATLLDIDGIPERARNSLLLWEGRYESASNDTPSQVARKALLRSTEDELAAVEARLQLLNWVQLLEGTGDPQNTVAQLQERIAQCIGDMEQESCQWVYSSVRILLEWVGLNPSGWGGYLVGTLLSQAMVSSVASGVDYSVQLHSLVDQMRQQAIPISAFAREVASRRDIPEDALSLEQRRDRLRERIQRLRDRD